MSKEARSAIGTKLPQIEAKHAKITLPAQRRTKEAIDLQL
jgi:hypothetical protein